MPGLSREQGILSARLSGTAKRHAAGRDAGDPVAALRRITTNPQLLGHAAAAFLVQTEQYPRDEHAPRALAYLRAAGADEAALAAEAEQVRRRVSHPPPSV